MEKLKKIVHKALFDGFELHAGQTLAARALFVEGKKRGFVRCGRKWGKTNFAIFCCYYIALLTERANVFYVSDTQRHAEKLVWTSQGGRMQNFLKPKWKDLFGVREVGGDNKAIEFGFNGSRIDVLGSDSGKTESAGAFEGLTIDFIAGDEFRLFRPEWLDTVRPNLFKGAPILLLGTPPPVKNHYIAEEEDVKRDPNGFFIHSPTTDNDKVPGLKEFVAAEEKRLTQIGKRDVFEREYLANVVFSGEAELLGGWSRGVKTLSNEEITKRLDGKVVEWCVIADPAVSSVFGVLFVAWLPNEGEFYVLGEMYVRDSQLARTSLICPDIQRVCLGWHNDVDAWRAVYDHAESWFAENANDFCDLAWFPCEKPSSDKHEGLSQVRDLYMAGRFYVSDEVFYLHEEAVAFVKKKNRDGVWVYPNKNVHLLDCLKYGVRYLGVVVKDVVEVVEEEVVDSWDNYFRQKAEDLKMEDYLEDNII